jgi:uncharacterized protein (DUF433 family)
MDGQAGVVTAFSPYHVMKLTGLSFRQLAYWDKFGFFKPEYPTGEEGEPYARIYSFKDVVGLRALSILKNKHGVSNAHLKEVGRQLAAYSNAPWAEIQLKVWNKRVIFDDPQTGGARGVVDGQYVLLPLIDVMEDVTKGIQDLKRRRFDQIGRIERHRHVSHNRPVVAGTRVPVRTILAFVEDGYSPEQIIEEFPSLTAADVTAAVEYGRSGLAA